jgi:hypothetical protein
VADAATADGPPRRRASWSLKTIVEDVAGKPIGEFQEPGRPVHPYLRTKLDEPSARERPSSAHASEEEAQYDPVGHLYPPLVGAHGREYHGPEHEHHAETLDRHPTVPAGVGERPRTAGPLHRPERLYLHYLLLHLDRLGDAALAYLRTAVEEEVAHRDRPKAAPVRTAANEPEGDSQPPAPPMLPMPSR